MRKHQYRGQTSGQRLSTHPIVQNPGLLPDLQIPTDYRSRASLQTRWDAREVAVIAQVSFTAGLPAFSVLYDESVVKAQPRVQTEDSGMGIVGINVKLLDRGLDFSVGRPSTRVGTPKFERPFQIFERFRIIVSVTGAIDQGPGQIPDRRDRQLMAWPMNCPRSQLSREGRSRLYHTARSVLTVGRSAHEQRGVLCRVAARRSLPWAIGHLVSVHRGRRVCGPGSDQS